MYDLVNIVKNLKNSNSVGHDDISLKYLKDSSEVTFSYILVIINTSIQTGIFPTQWKEAIVKPLHKSGDANEPSNFRPVSLLPILSKILEKAVANQLVTFLEENNILSNCQHAYRKNLSTETALLKVVEEIYEAIENNEISIVVSLDLSKAFDTVDPITLLDKLNEANIDSYWFDSYLHGRMQSVKINNIVSQSKNVAFGVPQGSILGPILFALYINNIANDLNCSIVFYADDAQFVIRGNINNIKGIIEATERTLTKLKIKFSQLGLKINPNKTQCIFVGSPTMTRNIDHNLYVNFDGYHINFSKNIKILGIILDENLLYDKHIESLCNKTKSTLIYLQRIKHKLDKATMKLIVESLVISKLNYCSLIYSKCSASLKKDVQKVQNFAAKVACGNGKKHDHATPFINNLEWLRMEENFRLAEGTFIYKVVTNRMPSWLINFPSNNSRQMGRVLRNVNELTVKDNKTSYGRKSLSYSGPQLFNGLPQCIKELLTVKSFKANMRSFEMQKRTVS